MGWSPALGRADLERVGGVVRAVIIERPPSVAGRRDLLRAVLDGRLTWLAEPFDEMGYRHVTVMFGDAVVVVARFHWTDLFGDEAWS